MRRIFPLVPGSQLQIIGFIAIVRGLVVAHKTRAEKQYGSETRRLGDLSAVPQDIELCIVLRECDSQNYQGMRVFTYLGICPCVCPEPQRSEPVKWGLWTRAPSIVGTCAKK
ncbi:hypothetical protein OPQ81_003638 [Rhizoctonia solani]|nr:hypothetical protein OPQ81_003638 [Rhizoctonia solani]